MENRLAGKRSPSENGVNARDYSLTALRERQDVAQAAFWQAEWPRVCEVCERILGPGLVANEVAVDVLEAFLSRYVDHLDDRGALHAYLRMMAVRHCLKEKQKRGRYDFADMDVFFDERDISQEEGSHLRAMMPRLQQCLGALTPKAQQAIRLHYKEGMTNEKVGARIGGSKQYIGRLLQQCREKLRKCLERERPDLYERLVSP
ncbi:MAG: hypothetical protein A2341_13965 [Deltaproteobacteria bacterium RIFOXYB12_FULL_58_9]|nr:MAG: hypothetical protein A2341_13965 [Deltaproteobacteria bacterium RIFOXYB12_FULL_58_9]